MNFERVYSVSFTEIGGQGVPDRRGGSGKSTFAVLLEPVAWDRESSCIACRAQSVTYRIQTEKVQGLCWDFFWSGTVMDIIKFCP